MQPRISSLRPTPILFAHRGARAYAPENTLESFALALRLGATGLETDVWLTADNVVVLDHDGVVKRGLRKKPIDEVDRKQLPSHIPTLTEFFDHCGRDFDLSIDIKDARALVPTASDARDAGFDLQRLWLCHPNYQFLRDHRRELHDVRLVDSTRLSKIKEGPERRMAALRDIGIDCINMHHTDWNGGLTTLAHKFDLHAFGWDVQHDDALTHSLRIGLDALFSDYTDRMVDAANKHAST